VLDALPNVLVGRDISEPLELILDCLRQCGVGDDRIHRGFRGELGIEVRDINLSGLRERIQVCSE
jgi:hypothetical protein